MATRKREPAKLPVMEECGCGCGVGDRKAVAVDPGHQGCAP